MVNFIAAMDRQFKIIVEKHSDVKSAIRFHIETFGDDVLADSAALFEAFIAEATISA